jgi:hypothetical protein
MHTSRPDAPLHGSRLAGAVFWGCSSRPKRDVLPESIYHCVVPAQYWRLCYDRSRAAGMSCCQMRATFAQPADQFAACSPEQADCLCKLKNQPQPIKEPDDRRESRIHKLKLRGKRSSATTMHCSNLESERTHSQTSNLVRRAFFKSNKAGLS